MGSPFRGYVGTRVRSTHMRTAIFASVNGATEAIMVDVA